MCRCGIAFVDDNNNSAVVTIYQTAKDITTTVQNATVYHQDMIQSNYFVHL